ncbi:uncharacterized protein [Onthophagus taurus]|uniref:uncharacterized protein n=1 Tax=Onthophagus taurus TaxID=166361 RepID=UPI000C20FA1C|nr:uncharacterized protein LOC111427479 [Onthophagus taurus]
MHRLVFIVCLVAAAHTLPTQEEARSSRNAIQTENDLLDSIYSDCLKKDSTSCVKYKLFSFVDKMLGARDTITVTEGVQIVKSENGEPEGAPRSISPDDSIESLLWNRVQRFLDTHTIKVDLKGSDLVNAVSSTARSFEDSLEPEVEEGRGKKKKAQKILGPLMMAAGLKMAILGKIALAVIALIAGKALMVAKIALVLSAIIGLKKLFSGSGKHVTYEVVAHPQHSSSHVASHETVYGGSGGGYGGGDGGYGGGSSGHGGWQRALDAQQLAYRGQNQSL